MHQSPQPRNHINNTKMSQESVFTNLPLEIIIDIISGLPIQTIIACKCVCKSWLKLLNTHDFTKSHLSKSLPGLITLSKSIQVFEFNDQLDLEQHELHYNPITKFDRHAVVSPSYHSIAIQGSVDGLLFLREINTQPNAFYICNPITREYMELRSQEKFVYSYPTKVTYGFGFSRTTAQHKVVRIVHACIVDKDSRELLKVHTSECHVYTLGTGLWRKFSHDDTLVYNCHSIGAFLNGKLHWLVDDLKGANRISCFDLETERFSILSLPFLPERTRLQVGLFVLEDCLCLCDNTSDDEIVIWLMKEYGVEKSWTKEYVIKKSDDFAGDSYCVVRPLKVFEDGDILMAWGEFSLFYYCNKTKTLKGRDIFDLNPVGSCIESMLHTSSFVSLKNFSPMEDVRSF